MTLAPLSPRHCKKGKSRYSSLWEPHLRTTGRHLLYEITQCYLPLDTSKGGMEGWVDLVDLIVPRPGVEPATFWSRVRCRTAAPPRQKSTEIFFVCLVAHGVKKAPAWFMHRHKKFGPQVQLVHVRLIGTKCNIDFAAEPKIYCNFQHWTSMQLRVECCPMLLWVYENIGQRLGQRLKNGIRLRKKTENWHWHDHYRVDWFRSSKNVTSVQGSPKHSNFCCFWKSGNFKEAFEIRLR